MRRASRLLPAGWGGMLLSLNLLLTPGCLGQSALAVQLNLHDGAREVSLLPELRLDFSDSMDTRSVLAAVTIEPAVSGAWRPDSSSRRYVLTPTSPLPEHTAYRVSVQRARDRDRHRTVSRHWTFTTGRGLHVLGALADAQGLASGGLLLATSTLGLRFSDPVLPASLHLSVDGTPFAAPVGTLTVSGDTLQLHPQALAPGAHHLQVTRASDAGGRILAQPWDFDLTVVVLPPVATTDLPYPLLVQVEDSPEARPQTGLQQADMIFDYQVEASITRLTAVYQHAPPVLGPIRSARFISIPLAQMYGGLLACSGVSEVTQRRIDQAGLPTLFDDGYYFRSGGRAAPHNLYAAGSDLLRAEHAVGLPARSLNLTGNQSVAWPGGANQVSAPGVDASFTFDSYAHDYLVSQSGIRATDASTGAPLRAATVVVMHTAFHVTDQVEDVNGAHALDYDLSSGGSAEFYADGGRIDGHWSRPGFRSPLRFTDAGGNPVTFPPGLIWVNVVG